MNDWYDKALEEFMYDGPLFTQVTPEAFERVYSFLRNEGLVDYDVEKEYLQITYADPNDEDEGCTEDEQS